jgi:hypothetical protein
VIFFVPLIEVLLYTEPAVSHRKANEPRCNKIPFLWSSSEFVDNHVQSYFLVMHRIRLNTGCTVYLTIRGGGRWRRWHVTNRVSTLYGIRFSHKTYRPSPTRDVTWKDPPLVRGPLLGVHCPSKNCLWSQHSPIEKWSSCDANKHLYWFALEWKNTIIDFYLLFII